MKQYDVLIIGGGVVGASIARELSRYKIRVGLLEKEEELAFGVSKSNSGIIHPGTQNPAGSLKGRLCVRGNALMRKICKDLGVDFKEVGELIVAFDAAEVQRLLELKDEGELLGVPGLKMVDRAWLSKNEPNLSDKAVAALYAPTAGIVSPYRLVYDLSENAAKNGVEFHTMAKAEAIAYSADERSRFVVTTTRGEFKTVYLINAAGLYADEISGMLGIDDFKIRPRKGEEYLLDRKKEHMTKHLLFPLPSKISKGSLVIKTADGNPMIGPTADDIEDKEDLATSDEGLMKVLSGAGKMLPSLEASDIIAYFAGVRPVAGSDFIIRYEDRIPGFINVAGIQSPGLTAAPAIALLVADLLRKNGLVLRKKRLFHKHRSKTEHLFTDTLSRAKKLIKKDKGYGDIVCRCEMVSAKEVTDAIKRGARTLDGIKFRTRAQAGRCHGGFCTTRLLRILSEETGKPMTEISKRGPGSEIVKGDRSHD
jgi:glycerol-3-phosphate dehydrogenase